MNSELKKLAKQAKNIGCGLFTDDCITLITYNAEGKVDQKFRYNYNDANYIDSIRNCLIEFTEPFRKKWAPEFLELAPVAFPLGYSIEIGYLSANLMGTTNSKSEVSKEEICLLECPFNRDGVHQMSDYLADVYMGIQPQRKKSEDEIKEQRQQKEREVEEEKQKEKEDIIMGAKEMDAETARAIAVIFYRLTAEEQQNLKNGRDEAVKDLITRALKISAEN